MADPKAPKVSNRAASKDRSRLKYSCDAGMLSCVHPPEAVNLDNEDSNGPLSSDYDSCDSTDDSTPLAKLSAGVRVFSDWLLTTKLSETEMIKAMEASRWEAEKLRAESEVEATRMLLRTQSQIASFVSATESRKRKRVEEDESRDSSKRRGALLLSLLQCDLDLFNKR
ncbi:hypothetical protein SLEP1_g14461 [Rubroshorea leprosula]|uniref:Uncharacterized protein n=1 Tax=Rubroshorea leprosula TaxID=152421 RepID=A0AAV5IJ34_9ROSI|nr:hypothetical protein SLEP1_g14461 [Rubroshorea leprosula]